LLDPAVPLVALGDALGIAPDAWARVEDVERLTYFDEGIDRIRAAALPLAAIRALAEAYGPALTCRFLLGDVSVLDVTADIDEALLTAFHDEIRLADILTLDLSLDKVRLADHWLGPVPGCRILLYLFPSALRSLVTGDITSLEQALWLPSSGGKVILLAPGADLQLDGEYLAVLGGSRVAGWQEVIPTSPPKADRAAELYRLCRESVQWEAAWIEQITPLHLKLEGDAAADDAVARALRVHLLNLVLLYLADRTNDGPGGQRQSTFNGARQRVTLTWSDPKAPPLAGPALEGLSALVALVDWAYSSPWSGDRLRMTQLALTDLLLAVEPEVCLDHLATGTAAVLDSLEWHWKVFIKEQTESYDADVRTLEDDAAKVLEDFGQQTTEMIKSLADTMLAAVAVVLAALVASLFSDSFKPRAFRFIGLLYAAYVALFPLGFNMLNLYERHRALMENFNARCGRFAARIQHERVEEIAGVPVRAARRRYRRWFTATVAAYVIVIGLALGAAYAAPTLGAMVQPAATDTLPPPVITPAPLTPTPGTQPEPTPTSPSLTP
jgi:hypothetical protein